MSEIHLTQVIDAPVECVWRACAEPLGLAAWQADEAGGELVPGGLLNLRWPALEVELELVVEELREGRSIVLRAGDSRLELALEPGRVSLCQTGAGEGDELEGVTSSWRMSLAILAHYCEHHAGRRRAVRWLVRRARTTPEAAHVFFTDAAALSTWLGRGGPIGETGTRYSLELSPGETLSGRVIANTPGRDVAITWDEDEGSVLCLRTLPRPISRDERWIALSWSRWSSTAPDRRVLERFDAAHHRLVRALSSDSDA